MAFVRAEVAGVVLDVAVAVGDHVCDGDVVALLESMKMQIPVVAEADGIVEVVAVDVGEFVSSEGLVVTLAPTPTDAADRRPDHPASWRPAPGGVATP